MKEFSLTLRFVIYKEGSLWFAHCLEFDIVAEADSPRTALADCLDLCAVQVEYADGERDLESLFRPAPPEFWVMYSKSKPSKLGLDLNNSQSRWPESFDVERIDARELEPCS